MGNLGLYQDITTLAKSMGGVDKMIKAIEVDAVKKAAPLLIGVGALIATGAKPVISAGRRGWGKYKESGVAAARAKEQLKSAVEQSIDAEDTDGDPAGVPGL